MRRVLLLLSALGAVGLAQPIPVSATAADRDERHAHHAGHGAPLTTQQSAVLVFYWGTGLPYLWTGAYTPAFLPFGATGNFPLANPLAPAGPAVNPPQIEPPAPAKSSKPRASNPETIARAGKFIGYGDANFGKQKYLAAVERYKTAGLVAPDLADVYFRQGHALVALAKYEESLKAFRRGLGLRADWHDSSFRLDQLYGDDRLAKNAHLENLAKAVEANPLDPNLLVVLGIELFFDGQRDRAEVFFVRAAQLGANEEQLLDGFLPKPGPKGAKEEDRRAGKIVF